ncbi:hypothetical protein BD413DRAFT_569883 [Trametes elegans]|nr:hypothetical protein BD413DRAFT_569883 [Trametes elegans]
MTTITVGTGASKVAMADLHDFFDRLAAGDYHALAKDLDIVPKISSRPTAPPTPSETISPAGEISFDSFDSYRFEPTVEGLDRAVSLLRGPSARAEPTPEDEEAFQFTFRLMIHKLYSIRDFAAMVDDVVRRSQARFQPLPAALTSRRRASLSFSFGDASAPDELAPASGGAGWGSVGSPSASESTLPSSPSLRSVDRLSESGKEFEGDSRVLKKRCIGRRLSVVDAEGEVADVEGPSWVYDSAVASMEAPASYAAFVDGLSPVSPVAGSPVRSGFGCASDGGEYPSRKRRFSFLAARG